MPRNKSLAPCPFCGCDQLKISPNMNSGLLRVQCEGCWATSITSNQRATIIAAWNRRATPQADASRSDVLEEAAKKVQTLLDDLYRRVNLIDSAFLHGAHHYVSQVLKIIRALKEKPHG